METRLAVKIDGPGVQPGKIALKDLQRIVHPLEQAVRALVPPTEPPSREGGRPKKPSVRFLLVGEIGTGSATANLELDTDIGLSLPSLEAEPIPALVSGVQHPDALLPAEAANPIKRMAATLPEGVDVVVLAYPDLEDPVLQVEIVRNDHGRRQSTSAEIQTVSGRLTEVNFAHGRARLQVPSVSSRRQRAEFIQLRFGDELAADMQRCARQLVSARGEATVSPTGDLQTVNVQRIWVEYDDRSGLWASKRLNWPEIEDRLDNVDVDDFLTNIHGVDEEPE
ncbi:MAG: hypothetical protein F4Y69_11515 [Chloroflexi bacterium]|nr:hypothetical protein [Chloroflexota bacterium]MYF22370.1 hypothetical protein [Chloroflexota bacterium]